MNDNKLLKAISSLRYVFYAVGVIGIAVLITLNTTITYKFIIERYDLVRFTGVSSEMLMVNYETIIYYLQNPFIKELSLQSFKMSSFGKIHFEEVKNIFIALYVIVVGFLSIISLEIIKNKNNNLKKRISNTLNNISNILIITFISITIMSFVDFSRLFVVFHKIFFRNDYWIFDASTDPVINALPEELFMIELFIVLALLVVFTLISKIFYYKNKQK